MCAHIEQHHQLMRFKLTSVACIWIGVRRGEGITCLGSDKTKSETSR